MARIFLSYAREDYAFAEMLSRILEGAGHEVWWDNRIDGGAEFGAEIEAALAEANVVVVVWSKDSVKSRWVKDEASVGGDSGRLVPLSIDGTTPPMGFRQFHTLDLTGWKGGKRDGRTVALKSAVARRTAECGDGPAQASVSESKQPLSRAHRPLILVVATLLVVGLLVGSFLFWRGYSSRSVSSVSVDILPIDASARDSALQDLGAQMRDSLGQALSDEGIVVRTVPAAAGRGSQADFIINGHISRTTDKLVADIRVDDPDNNITVYTRRLEIEPQQAQILPERVAAQIAGTLAWARPLIALERRHPSSPPVTSDLLRQLDFTADPLQSFQIAKRAYQVSPNSSFAQVAFAFGVANTLSGIPIGQRAAQVTAARKAAAEALASAPEFGDIYALPCLLQSEVLSANCEGHMLEGLRRDPQAPFLDAFLSVHYRSLGRFAESQELARLSSSRNPYVPTKLARTMRADEFSGDTAEADQIYQRGLKWWPEFAELFGSNRLAGMLQRGDFNRMAALLRILGPNGTPRGLRGREGLVLVLARGSPASKRAACSAAPRDYWPDRLCLIALASIGDLDTAYAIADRMYSARVGRSASETEAIWLREPEPESTEYLVAPSAAPLRRDPRFLPLAKRVGLLDYWRSGKLPDFCRKQPEPVCKQLLARK